MKKNISILLIFMLLFSITTPYQTQTAFAAGFSATVEGSIGNETREVKVINAKPGSILRLYKEGDSAALQTTESITNNQHTFTVQEFGKYYVTEMIDGAVSDPSVTVQVRPGAVTISREGENIKPDEIIVTNAIPGAELILHNDRIGYIPRKVTANEIGIGNFLQVPPGIGYTASQKINGVESPRSNQYIDIRPNVVEYTASPSAGPNNDQGWISVIEAFPNATVRLFDKGGQLIASQQADSSGNTTFSNLKAGDYTVTQTYNGAESFPATVKIGDAQAPVITLIGASEHRMIIGDTFTDPGAKVTDNIDGEWEITGFHPEMKDKIFTPTTPGIYELKYNDEDRNGNKAIEVIRKVIVEPKKVELTPTHTDPNKHDDIYGDIHVKNVFPNSTLYLYQDQGENEEGKLIRVIENVNAEVYTFTDVPVGKNYYVIQEFKNDNGSVVKSEPSTRVEVMDKTPPRLFLNGESPINLVVRDTYIEYGARATDNIDDEADITAKIQIEGTVNTSIPGKYEVTYSVTDNAGNAAVSITREVIVRPGAVTAIGSTADIGEVGVKNAFPDATLTLWKIGNPNDIAKETYELTSGETTHVFKNVEPGSYYVTQHAGGYDSAKSNIVEVVDVDRPHITLEGPEKLFFVWDESKKPYYDGATNTFTDPGATAKDYIDKDLTSEIEVNGKNLQNNSTHKFDAPGMYSFTYTVEAKRGTKADEKYRTVSVAPPAIADLTSEAGKSSITVKGQFQRADIETTIALYDAYHMLIDTVTVENTAAPVTFEDVPAGLGYYVTQTVNGVESAPSKPINVSLYPDAGNAALITAFSFKGIATNGMIDHENGTIGITLPAGTDLKKLTPIIEKNGEIVTGPTNQADFSKPVIYKVKNGENEKTYTISAEVANSQSNVWQDTVNKNVFVTSLLRDFTLTASEKALANQNGISFLATDMGIHVPAATVRTSNQATLTVSKPLASTVHNAQDPVWRTSLSNITEIKWGQNPSYLQPIELELPNPNGKAFAKLVRENGKLYAILQPSEMVGGNLVGFVTEPGIYALVDSIKQPTITTVQGDLEKTYKLSSTTAGASIYYMTNSSQITFDKSAQKKVNPVTGHAIIGSPTLDGWAQYKGGNISPVNDELYAVAVHNQMISRVRAIQPTPPSQWKGKPIPTVSRHKVWTVSFNARVDEKALYTDSIYVTDDATGKRIDTTLQLSADGKSVTVSPVNAYGANRQYTLWVDKEMKGNTTEKNFLKQSTKLTFITK